MKNLITLFIVLLTAATFGQVIPSDSVVKFQVRNGQVRKVVGNSDTQKFTITQWNALTSLQKAAVQDAVIVDANGNAINAEGVGIADAGVIITATEVEGALQENRTAIDLNTAKVTANTANVTTAGALMDSEVDADIKTMTIAASSTISGSNTGDVTPEDTAYGVGWNADTDAASKNSIYDEMETRVDSDVTGVTGADVVDNIMSLTQAEYDAITPDAATFYIITDATTTYREAIAISDNTTDLTTGTKMTWYSPPYAITITDAEASLLTAATGAELIVDVHDDGVTIMGTNKLDIEVSEFHTKDATTQPAISAGSIAAGSKLEAIIDQVGSTIAGAGAIVYIYYTID